MLKEGKLWIGNTEDGREAYILPGMANRHGIVCGATGTGKTVTLKVMAESFSAMGVPVFMADVKGDIAGMMEPGADTEDMQKRIEKFGLADAGFSYSGCPVTLWDILGKKGIPLRTTISEIGPMLLARILALNDLQSDILSIIFRIADESKLLLVDTKDLKAMLSWVSDHPEQYEGTYGKISSASVGAIIRSIVALEADGGDVFFGEPALNIADWLTLGDGGKGMIHILDSSSLISNGRLYSTFLLWMLSELFETLPEVGDRAKPKMVFFFDEAHLLFDGASKALLDKIEQVVKLIRSKGVGVYFCTQNPKDIPDGVLSQLGNKIEHALRAYTLADQKAVKAAAQSFRPNPAFDTYEAITTLGTGQAVVSFLDENGVPGIAERVSILPPQCSMASIRETMRDQCIKDSLLYSKYANAYDPESAYEFLERQGQEEAAGRLREAEAAAQAKEQAKQEEREARARERAEAAESRARNRAIKSVGSTVLGTVGRQVGQSMGKSMGGSFGKTMGGNIGASLLRGIFGTLFKG
ncbi:MAG: helicase HerA-like domain-containing protein [Dialister sp.]|nr:helicase HerA-like domain-containing protein [Dialister sp.]